MTTAQVKKENCLKYFGQEKEDETSPNYPEYVEAMRTWYTSSERYWLGVEQLQQEAIEEKDYYTLGCDKYHAWKDDQL